MKTLEQNVEKCTASFFEDDYLVRTLGRIAHDPEVALTELVANAWDAGASTVDLTIPLTRDFPLTVQDDGHGMTEMQFKSRWMRLGYDRIKHQGPNVVFPINRKDLHRKAYGRNGVGRHGLLCFANQYSVETWCDGQGARFCIGTRSQETPFRIVSASSFVHPGHGTRLSVSIDRHLPDADRIRAILSVRFLHDPQFVVRVNGHSVSLAEQTGLVDRRDLNVPGAPPARAYVVDSQRAGKSTLNHGVAFWVNGRLVGSPSWIVGATAVVDGRARIARQYSIVIKTDDEWISEVEPDWARFKSSAKTEALFEAARQYVQIGFAARSASAVEESSEEVLMRNREQFKLLSQLGRAEVATFARAFVKSTPAVSQDVLSAAVQALINLEKARGGAALLKKLVQLDEFDIDGLDRLLGQWRIHDALSVLDEIDHRLAVLAAIDKLSGDAGADELHTLHPLVTQARWLFGPEFDSSEYVSNVSLRTAAQKIFQKRLSAEAFLNDKQRPDVMTLADATVSIVGTDAFDSADAGLARIQSVLIIELKKGRSAIGRAEMAQADGYVQDFLSSGAIDGVPMIRAFVIGHEIAQKTTKEKELKEEGVLRGRVVAATYGQLTRSAHQRLFRLRERIPARYDDVSGADLSAKVMRTASQANFELLEPHMLDS